MADKKNFLDFVPVAAREITVVKGGDDDLNHLEVAHKSWADWLAQKLWHRPAVTTVTLEPMGSFIWEQIDGKRSIYEIAGMVSERFGEAAEPLYGRIAAYFKTLERCGYVRWRK